MPGTRQINRSGAQCMIMPTYHWTAPNGGSPSPFEISPGGAGVLPARHVADVRLWARLRTQERGDKGMDAGHVGDIASGAS
jgi:hypothetical protein